MLTFGPFEFDPDTGDLHRDGVLVHVPPQPAAALRLLLAEPGALVTREAFRAEIWRGVDHLDFTAGLHFCIGQLRNVLGDRGTAPQFIAAVPKRGYRFIADVRVVTAPAAVTPSELRQVALPPARTPRRWGRWPLAVAGALLLAATFSSSTARGAGPGTNDLVAAKAMVRAAPGLSDAGPEEIETRVALFDQAIARDAGFGDAYAGRAEGLLLLGQYRARTPAAAYAEALVNAQRAITLTPESAGAHAVYGTALLYATRDWSNAERHLRLAVSLDRAPASAHQWYSRFLSASGRHDDAMREGAEAVRLAPASASAHTALGWARFYAGQYDQAITACGDALGLLPAFAPARFCVAAATAESTPHNESYWRSRLLKLENSLAAGACACDTPLVAVPLAHLGSSDRALTALEVGADRMSDTVLFAGVHPAFSTLRNTRRFTFLLRRIGIARP